MPKLEPPAGAENHVRIEADLVKLLLGLQPDDDGAAARG